jgi:O-antigen ligase
VIVLAALIGLVAVGAILGGRHYGYPTIAFCVCLIAVAVVPKNITSTGGDSPSDIAPGSFTVSNYLLFVGVLALLAVLHRLHRGGKRLLPVSALVFLLFLVLEFLFSWSGTSEQVSGIVQLFLGFAAWGAGAYLGPKLLANERSIRLIALTILFIAGVQALVAIAQRMGITINPMDPKLASEMGNRTNGTLTHPNNLGKVALMLLILSLALVAGGISRRTRSILWISIIVLIVPLGLSQGRANMVAALLTVVFWAALSPRDRPLRLRLGVPLAAVLVALPFVGAILAREQDDPDGGPRGQLSATAIDQIHMHPLFGLGPNSYVSIVSDYDAVVAAGYPVHNTFLLTAAEFGIPAAVLFWIPLLLLLLACWRARTLGGFPASFGVATLASAPGMYVVLSTGWAMLSASLLPFWFLLLGITYSQVTGPNRKALAVLATTRQRLRASGPTTAVSRDFYPTPPGFANTDPTMNPRPIRPTVLTTRSRR